MLPFSKKSAIVIASVSALFASIGDVLLLYSPSGRYFSSFQFYHDIGIERMVIGHYLGVFFIPLYIFGFYVLFLLFKSSSAQLGKSIFWVATLLLFPGVAYHAYCSAMAIDIQTQFKDGMGPTAQLLYFSQPMVIIFVSGFFIFSALLSWAIFKGKTKLSRRVAFFNPIVIYFVCVLLYLFVPSIGNYLIVAGFNLSLLALFLAITLDQWNTGLN